MNHADIELKAGDVFAGYRVVQKLGPGVMGTVYLARDTGTVRRVALKVLAPEFTSDVEYVQLFEQQAATATRIDHRNVARFYAAGEEQGRLYTASEFIRGDTLALLIERQGRLDVQIALSLLLTIGRALAYLHTRSVIHGGVNPGNIRFTPTGEVKLVDAGLAKKLLLRPERPEAKATVTPVYLAPELVGRPARVDARADIYSLGITAYEALTGKKPFLGDSPHETVLRIMNEPLRAEDMKGIHPDIASLIVRMTAKNPDDRPPSMPAVLAELERAAAKLAPVLVGAGPSESARDAMARRTARARRRTLFYILVGVVVVATFLAFHLPGTSPTQPRGAKPSTAEQQAALALQVAAAFEADNPEDTAAALERYRSTAGSFPNTTAGEKARAAQQRLALKLTTMEAGRLEAQGRLYEAAAVYGAFEKQYAATAYSSDAGRKKTLLLLEIEDRFNNDMLEAASLCQNSQVQQAVALLEQAETYGSPRHKQKARSKIDEMLRSAGPPGLRGPLAVAWPAAEPMVTVITRQIADQLYEPAETSCDTFLSCPLPEGVAQIVRLERDDIVRLRKVLENFNAALGDAADRGGQTSFTLIDGTVVSGLVRAERREYYLYFSDDRKWRIRPADLASGNVLKLAGMDVDEPDAVLTAALYELYHGTVEKARVLFARLSSRLDKKTLVRYGNKLVVVASLLAGRTSRARTPVDPRDIRQAVKILERARRVIKQKNWNQAYPLLRQAAQLNPAEWETWRLLGLCAAAKGLPVDAIQYYRKALALSPGNSNLWNELGKLHLARDELGLALAAFRQAACTNPADPIAMHGRVETLLRLGREDEARHVQEEWEKNRRR